MSICRKSKEVRRSVEARREEAVEKTYEFQLCKYTE